MEATVNPDFDSQSFEWGSRRVIVIRGIQLAEGRVSKNAPTDMKWVWSIVVTTKALNKDSMHSPSEPAYV